jgi:hypothetical protein
MDLMSWSDDIRCLYCGGRLPLYRKITQGQFCSTAHRKEYWKEQERLALERLTQTHNSLRIFEPGAPADPAGEVHVRAEELVPATAPVEVPTSAGGTGLETLETGLPAMTGLVPTSMAPAKELVPEVIAADPLEYEIETKPRRPVSSGCAQESGTFPPVDLIRGLSKVVGNSSASEAASLKALEPKLEPVRPDGGTLRLDLGDESAELYAQIAQEAASAEPGQQGPIRMRPALRPAENSSDRLAKALPLPEAVRPPQLCTGTPGRAPGFARGLRLGLRVPAAPPVHKTRKVACRAVRFSGTKDVARTQLQPAIPERRPRLASGRRYPVTQPVFPRWTSAPCKPVTFSPAQARRLPRLATGIVEDVLPALDPQAAGLAKLTFPQVALKPAPARHYAIFSIPQPPRINPALPALRLEPLDSKPVAELPVDPGSAPFRPQPPLQKSVAAGQQPRWVQLRGLSSRIWSETPQHVKFLAIAAPLLMALALQPSVWSLDLGGSKTGARFSQAFSNFQQAVSERAAVALDEDFRSGLDQWISRGGEPVAWSYDATGFVLPVNLALYSPSTELTDYEMQFLGMIDKKAMSWVVRAADFDNYYVIKLSVLKPGPVPEIGITRYAVIDGQAMDRADTVVPISARADTLYRVRLNVRGGDFALTVQGQTVDSWTDNRLRRGGIGFFNARGEESRVGWVQITHQYDTLGRLCAYLAPQSIPWTNGSYQQ